jgi:uncharacterized Rossmann fold enzyme
MAVVDVAGDLWADNLAAFGRYMPEMLPRLTNYVPLSRLVDNPDGSHDVEFRGQRLYDIAGDGTTGPELARRAVDALRGTGRGRLLINPLDRKSLDQTTLVYTSRLLKKGVDDGISFLEMPNGDDSYHLVVMGMGLGYHLTELIGLCQPFSICIVEPNLDFLFHSLSVFDWRPLLERRGAWPSAVTILTSDKSEEISRLVRIHCRNANPAASDALLVAASYANDAMDMATKLFRRDAHLIHTGLGFFQDEMEMVRASYFNLVPHEDFRVFRRAQKRAELPAFIVGSGPSIDDDLDFIKANQDRAVIFCCGSALGVLLANGIRPDFQMMLENGEAPREMLESMAKSYSFEGIRLIGSNTISPQIRPLFKDRSFYMRKSLSSYSMFSPGEEYSLDRSGPTVTNTGLEAALWSGFHDIYLFGCDLGARSPERHHSRFSPYHMAERNAGYDAAVVFAQTLPARELGNFGGIAFTNDIMTWSRDAMEGSIAGTGAGRRIYNCSDGIRIKGARPQVSAGVKIAAPKRLKAEIVADMWNHFPEASTFGFAKIWGSTDWRARVRSYADRLAEICQTIPERSQEFLHLMAPILIPDHQRQPSFEEYFLRGTAFVSIISADYYVRRVHPKELRPAFRNDAYAGIVDLLDTMVEQTRWFFDHIDELHTHTDLKRELSAWTENEIPSSKT